MNECTECYKIVRSGLTSYLAQESGLSDDKNGEYTDFCEAEKEEKNVSITGRCGKIINNGFRCIR